MGPRLLKRIVSELDSTLRGGVVSRVHQPDARNIIFKVFARGRQHNLIISTHPTLSRIHLTARRYPNPPVPLRFCAFLRSRLNDARIERLSQLDDERIVRIGFVKRDKEDRETTYRYTLVAELTGKSSNVILLDEDGVVLDALRYFHPGAARTVVPGVRLAPLTLPEGLSMKEEEITPQEGETWNQAADRYYSRLVDAEELEAEKRRLRQVIKRAAQRAKRKLENLIGDRRKAEADIQCSRLGELLLANFKRIEKGMTGIEVEDYYATPPQRVRIPLDPALSPRENVDRYFKRARKAKTALAMLKDRIPEVEREIEYIEGLLCEWECMETREDAEALREELIEAGYLRPPAGEGTGRPVAEPVRRFLSKDGFEILCGKSGRGNDLLVRRYASRGDLWFHAKGVPGAHVLLKTGGRRPTEEAVEEAACIAAYYSKARSSAKVEVIFADAANVQKPKGARPGTVTVREYRTVVVRPAPGASKRTGTT